MVGGEREQLNGFLDFLRGTVVVKAAGLTDEQARRPLVASRLTAIAAAAVPPALGGALLVRHRAERPAGRLGRGRMKADRDAEFRVGLDLPLSRLIADYEAECAASREIAARLDLDATGDHGAANR